MPNSPEKIAGKRYMRVCDFKLKQVHMHCTETDANCSKFHWYCYLCNTDKEQSCSSSDVLVMVFRFVHCERTLHLPLPSIFVALGLDHQKLA